MRNDMVVHVLVHTSPGVESCIVIFSLFIYLAMCFSPLTRCCPFFGGVVCRVFVPTISSMELGSAFQATRRCSVCEAVSPSRERPQAGR